MDKIQVSLDTLAASVHSRMTAFEEELKKEPATKADNIKNISADFQCFRDFVMMALGALQKQVEMLSAELDGMEMRSRRKMLLLHGVPEEKSENIVAVTVALAHKHLSLPELQPEDIRRAHRMGRLNTSSSKPRPVLVKFASTRIRDDAWMGKVGLKGTGITLSEFLTPKRHKLFKAARLKLGVTKCWTREGRIIYLAPDGKRHHITSQQDLERLVGEPQSPGTGASDTESPNSAQALGKQPATQAGAETSAAKISGGSKASATVPKRARVPWFVLVAAVPVYWCTDGNVVENCK